MSHYTDENGRLHVVIDDVDTPVYGSLSGGILSIMVRADNEDTFNTVGLQVGLLRYENEGKPEELDPETGEVISPEELPSGEIIPAGTATVTRIGSHVITPPTLDDDGNVVAEGVYDNRYHANAWIREESNWESWIVQWMAGTPGSPNANEASIEALGVELIDPLTVSSPANVLL